MEGREILRLCRYDVARRIPGAPGIRAEDVVMTYAKRICVKIY